MQLQTDLVQIQKAADEERWGEVLQQADSILQQTPNEPDILLLKAKALMNLHKYEEACDLLKQVIELKPELSEAKLLLAEIYSDMDDDDKYDEIPSLLQAVIQKEPNNEKALLMLVNYFRDNRKLKSAEQYAQKLLEIDPKNPRYHQIYGDIMARERNYTIALEHYHRVVELDPTNERALFQIASIFELQKHYKEAIDYYQRILELNPRHKLSYYYIALCYFKIENYKTALQYLDRLLNLEKNNTDALELKVNCYIELEEYENALQTIQEWKKADPEQVEPLVKEAEIYARLNQYEKALAIQDEILKHQKSPALLEQKAQILIKLKRFEEALKALDEALQYNPYSWDILNRILQLHQEKGLEEKSLELLNKLMSQSRNLPPELLKKKFQVLQRLDRPKEALEILEKIEPHYQDDPNYWFNKGFLYRALGNEEKAKECFDIGLELNPHEPKLWYYKAMFFASMRKKEETLSLLKKAFQIDPLLIRQAREEELFDFLRNDEEFQKLIYS